MVRFWEVQWEATRRKKFSFLFKHHCDYCMENDIDIARMEVENPVRMEFQKTVRC